MAQLRAEPIRPEARPARLSPTSSAIVVLDLTIRCEDPEQPCSELIADVGRFLDRARAARVPIVFSSSHNARGTPEAAIAAGLHHREADEPVIYANGFDKFTGGELQSLLAARNVEDLVIIGSSVHIAVLYTAHASSDVDPNRAMKTARHYYDVYQLLRDTDVCEELRNLGADTVARDVVTYSAAAGLPAEPRPAGGFAQSPAFGGGPLLADAQVAYEGVMDQLVWPGAGRPTFPACLAAVHAAADLL